jgi:hypothetical protein
MVTASREEAIFLTDFEESDSPFTKLNKTTEAMPAAMMISARPKPRSFFGTGGIPKTERHQFINQVPHGSDEIY